MRLVFCNNESPSFLFLFTNFRSISSRQRSRQAFLNCLCSPLLSLTHGCFLFITGKTWVCLFQVATSNLNSYNPCDCSSSCWLWKDKSTAFWKLMTALPRPLPHPGLETLGSLQSSNHSVNIMRQCYQNNVTSRYCMDWPDVVEKQAYQRFP